MKLQLEQLEGVVFLAITGTVEARDVQVLKAGLTKILRDGKNRIVVCFEELEKLDSEVVREISVIDLTARELAGQIAIVSSVKSVGEAIKNFAKPATLPFFETKEKALDFFQKKKPDEEDASETTAALKNQLAAKDKEISSLKDQLKMLNPAEVKKLRVEKIELASKVSILMEQLEDLMLKRKMPTDIEGFVGTIEALEDTVKQLTDRVEKVTK